jgi:hypothetical protein
VEAALIHVEERKEDAKAPKNGSTFLGHKGLENLM